HHINVERINLQLFPLESDASHKCLDHYNYDKSMCSVYFQRYKNCRKYWVSLVGVPNLFDATDRNDTVFTDQSFEFRRVIYVAKLGRKKRSAEYRGT
uniref:Coiled-coil-helix-coiled-coil-helix domain-containing protein 7 n=1 Tax=Oryzias sinensis TaxID=183150 RepID=A0A8C8DGI1_9TELE